MYFLIDYSLLLNFYRLDFPSWVNVIAATGNGELILIRQYRFGTNRVEIEIPRGAVNVGEIPTAAGLRELLEETGYSGKNRRLQSKTARYERTPLPSFWEMN
ncbi:MAG: NUDIX hydrolase [Proteobacteria bacterium]|nr:NUDIX hydrolase [Pseudomonadota bacterium]